MGRKSINFKWINCLECGKSFKQMVKKRGGGLPNGIRSCNCFTCSEECAKLMNRKRNHNSIKKIKEK